MITYYLTTVLGTWLAQLAGNGTLPNADRTARPPSTRTPAEKLVVVLVAALFIGVAGFRYRIGVDYWQYAESWSYRYSQFDWRVAGPGEESGFSLLATLAARLHNDPSSMFFAATLVTVGLLVRTYAKHSPMFAVSILLMVLGGSWHGSFNGVRQFMAAAIVLAGFRLVIERRFARFFVLVLLASTFHLSAWICLLLYFVPRRSLTLSKVVMLLMLVVLAVASYDQIGLVIDDVRGQEVSGGAYFEEQVNPLRILMAAAPALVYLLFARKDHIAPAGHYLVNIGVVHAAVMSVSVFSAYLARFAIYPQVFIPLTWAAVIPALSRQSRMWIVPLSVVAYAVFWYVEVAATSALNPFRFIWGQDG